MWNPLALHATAARRRRCPLRLLSLLCALSTAGPGVAAPLPGPNPNVLRPTSTGSVRGLVVDAKTRRPLPGAKVCLEENGAFAQTGPAVAVTDEAGAYAARTLIGRSWSKIDWMRVFTSFPLLLALQPQSAVRQSNTILVTRLNVRAECAGYRPFIGEVRASRLDAGKFLVMLDDVWLAPVASDQASFSPDNVRYEWIESFRVTPAIARAGESITVEACVHLPTGRGARYRVFFDSTEPGLVKTEQRLDPVGAADAATGIATFRRTLRLPSKPRVLTTELSPWISRDYHEIPVGWESKTLLQVVSDDTAREPAEQVATAYGHLQDRDLGAAVTTLAEVSSTYPSYAPAYRYLGEACASLGRTDEAATAYERLVALEPENLDVAWTRYVDALLDGGRADAVATALEAAGQHTKRLPASMTLARARLLARRGDLRGADEDLARVGRRGRIPRPIQREIALRRAEAALRAQPDSPDAELALSRALADMDRLEEASRHARRAQQLRPAEPWPLVELAALERPLGHDAAATAALERALALDPGNADAHLAVGQVLLARGDATAARDHFRQASERRPYDFAARQGLALAELRVGDRKAALAELRIAAVIGRGKGETDPGVEVPLGPLSSLYFGPKRHVIQGFSLQDAATDFQLIQALERIAGQPDDALAQLSAGTALVRLRQPEPALAFLDRAGVLEPKLADLTFWRALALIGLDRDTDARQLLEETLRQNPLHPHAHRILARLSLETGDFGQAQAQLAAQRHNWPNEREIDDPTER